MARIALAGVSIGTVAHAAAGEPARAERALQTRLGAVRSLAPNDGSVRLIIPKGPLEKGLVAFTQQAGVKLVYPTELTETLETQGLEGEFAPIDALDKLLEGTGLTHQLAGTSTITLVNPRYVQLGADPASAVNLDELHVQGEGRGRAGSRGLPPPSGTVGQPPPPYAGGQVATGTRVGFLGNRSVQKTPFSITGYTDKLNRDQVALTVGDVIQNNPSIRIDSPPFSERDSYFIRGFSVTNLDTAFDGLFYIANPRRTQLEGIERVEVLLGPTALLAGGTGRVGGTINLVPKRAFDAPLTRVNTFYISDSQFGSHIDMGRRMGPQNEWGVRLNAAYRNGATPLDNTSLEVGNVTLGLDYRGDRFRASLDLAHSTQNVTAPTSLFNSVAPGIAVPRAPNNRRNTANPFEFNDSRYQMAAGRMEYDLLPDTTVYAAGGISRYREDFLTSTYQVTSPTGLATNTLAIQPLELQGRTFELGLRSQFQTGFVGHQLNVAVTEAYNGNFSRSPGQPRFAPTLTNIYDPIYLPGSPISPALFPRSSQQPLFADLSARSVAFADTLALGGDRVLLTLGGRYQTIDQKGYVTATGPTQGSISSDYVESRFTPAIALSVSPLDNLTFYGNYIESLNPGPTAPFNAANANEIFAPVSSDQKEVGAKYDFGTVALTAALFEITQPNAFTDPGTRIFSLAGLQRNRGLEFTVFGEPIEGVRLLGGVTFIDAQQVRTAGGQFDGNAATGVPTTAFNLYGEYDMPPWLAPGLTLTGRAVYTSSQFYNLANTQFIPDWTRFDAGLRYAFEGPWGKPVVARAIVTNLLDDSYWVTAARGFLAVGAPRTFILSASMDF